MVAYCFATTQTVEGSVKKGILRMAGTVTGVRPLLYLLPASYLRMLWFCLFLNLTCT